MDESTDAISKDCDHQSLERRGCIAITHLHYLASEVPSTVANAILWMCSSTMHICSYASDILSFDRYAALAISLQMISWSGNRVTSLTVLLFCSRKLKTVHNLLFFFGMQSIGTA